MASDSFTHGSNSDAGIFPIFVGMIDYLIMHIFLLKNYVMF